MELDEVKEKLKRVKDDFARMESHYQEKIREQNDELKQKQKQADALREKIALQKRQLVQLEVGCTRLVFAHPPLQSRPHVYTA